MLNKLSPFLFISRFTLSVVYEKKSLHIKQLIFYIPFLTFFFTMSIHPPLDKEYQLFFQFVTFPIFTPAPSSVPLFHHLALIIITFRLYFLSPFTLIPMGLMNHTKVVTFMSRHFLFLFHFL